MRSNNILPKNLAIAVCCHFNESRLGYLDRISNDFSSLADWVTVIIVTNTSNPNELEKIESVISGKNFNYQFFIPDTLGHPLLLTWAHFVVFKDFLQDESFTHFMYLEDDTLITQENMMYWIEGRKLLNPYGLIPSFLRVEKRRGDSQWFCSDCPSPFFIYGLPRIRVRENFGFINLPELYQGMYLMDRELMQEFFNGPSYSPNFGVWGIQEKATQGVTFLNIPKGYSTRNLIPYRINDCQLDERCQIHHLPNNYADPPFGGKVVKTIPVNQLLSRWPTREFLERRRLKKFLRSHIGGIFKRN